jgi:plasmid stabilization system protein ParE
VEVSRAATRKLAAHIAFVARVNQAAALRLHEEILADMRGLENHPAIHPPYDSDRFPDLGLRRKITARRYRLVFAIREEEKLVTVVDVQDCRQGEGKNLV